MPSWLLNIQIIDGPVPLVIWGVTAVLILLLLLRRPTKRWVRRALIGIVVGAIVGAGLYAVVMLLKLFGETLPATLPLWSTGLFAALGLAVVSLWDSRAWRKVIAILLVPLALVSAVLGVNAAFHLDKTIGDMLGVSTQSGIDGLPGPQTDQPTGPVYEKWNPPADMPATGKIGGLQGANAIPSSAGFKPRDASIYLPPAAQVKNAPPLPLVVFMMGRPSYPPDAKVIAPALDKLAAQNKGLAPIVIVVDQLGDPANDPACVDSKKYGGVDTYINKDVVAYAEQHLNIIKDKKYWTMSGFSNGGACAATFAAKYPETWGNLVSISGDQYGAEGVDAAVQELFGGDRAAFDASTPAALMQKNTGKFSGHTAVFVSGGNDNEFTKYAQEHTQRAQQAGFQVVSYVVPGADHNTVLDDGPGYAFEQLYPKLGLAPPK